MNFVKCDPVTLSYCETKKGECPPHTPQAIAAASIW